VDEGTAQSPARMSASTPTCLELRSTRGALGFNAKPTFSEACRATRPKLEGKEHSMTLTLHLKPELEAGWESAACGKLRVEAEVRGAMEERKRAWKMALMRAAGTRT
jgi:hypothetical protein